MAQRIRRFGIGQTAKMLGVLYALIGVVLIPIFIIATSFTPGGSTYGMGFAIALPLLYGIIGFVFTAIACAIYNMVAGWIGGIEVELAEPAA
ncbi:MAG TPA: hypothetical protein VHM24_02835 [Gemmatimonadaceae bacterium]|nr:hypothetical protein [Gemmatimonadaceae bacterium]